MKKLKIHIENSLLFLLNFSIFFQNISFKEKIFSCFFPLSNLTQISTVNFWAHVGRKRVTYLLNKFYKWSLIFVGLNFRRLRKSSSLRADFFWLKRQSNCHPR